uniref:Nuclear protein localization protein 4 n=1 Tax=Globodera rostochiensis TaxID=31243 RepID=A0A914GYV8_GLORO
MLSSNSDDKIDDIDKLLSKLDGKIERQLDPLMCRHGPRQKCTNCLPLDPYDENFLREKDIKHLSFHAYVRKLTDLHGKGTRSNNVLENGICTRCRPSTLTLTRQPFRQVDNIEFTNAHIVNNFLNFWRSSSFQRIGYLIGQYEPFAEVPLGIKAAIFAIYEPPQRSTESSVVLDNDPHEERVDRLCTLLGMKRLGWIFTDLWSEDPREGTVHCIRNEESFLLSSSECITAGNFQSKYRNYTKYCDDGYFGSKFVTVVASGNRDKRIDFHGYQVSNQCTAMVEAEILCPTKKYPELAWAREKPLTNSHYITNVEFTEKDEFGMEVRRNGRPMPVEYLLVDVPCGVRKQELHKFAVPTSAEATFPIENRTIIDQNQNLSSLSKYVRAFVLPDQFLEMASDFHFLLFLFTNHFIEFGDAELETVVALVQKGDAEGAKKWAQQNANWGTLNLLLQSGGAGGHSPIAAVNENEVGSWSCQHCTMRNPSSRNDCSMCNLPKGN